jgi:hypothetical protein
MPTARSIPRPVRDQLARRGLWIAGCLATLLALSVLSAPTSASTSASACPPAGAGGHPFHESKVGPKGQPRPEQILACIGSQAITGATYRHWTAIAESDSETSPQHSSSARELTTQVMGFLISADWVIGEANALRVHVSIGAVRHKFAELRKQQFPKSSAFKAFLRKSHQTVRDLQLRVQLNLLTQLIQKHVTARHRGSAAQQHALSNFVRAFKIRWKAQTYCQAEYAVSDCGHVRGAV